MNDNSDSATGDLSNEPELLRIGQPHPRIDLAPISHDLANPALSEQIRFASESEEYTVQFVEGSLYLGGFIPQDARLDKIQVILEEPSMFVRKIGANSLAAFHLGGRDIPPSSRGHRRLFEAIAQEIRSGVSRADLLRIVRELLYLRSHHANVIVYNEPSAWLRTVWYEADVMFHYAAAKCDFKLFGAFIYSDLDIDFASYLKRSAVAIHAMTGDDVLLFSFGEPSTDSELSAALDYVCYRCVMETPGRLAKSMTPIEIDEMRAREDRMLSYVHGKNRSLLFGRKLGVSASQTPCIIFWTSLDENRHVTVPLDSYDDDKARSTAIKRLADAIASAVADEHADPLEALAEGVSGLNLRQGDAAIGDVLRSLLDHSSGSSDE